MFRHPGTEMKGFELMKEREVDWDEVFSIVKNQKILPLVHQTLRDSNLSDVPEEFVNRIRKEFHRNGLLIQMQKNALSHVWKAFSSTSIPVLFFKGPVLGGMAYGSPIWRKPGDIDILIQPSDYAEARQTLVGVGYEVNKPPYVERKLRLRGSEMVFSRNGFEVDLHWSLEQTAFNRFAFSPGLDQEAIWERSTTCLIDNEPIPCMSYEDTLFFLCAHGGKHGWTYLYMICDIAMLISQNKDMDWERVTGLAKKLHTERVTFMGLYLAHKICCVELPDAVMKAIKRHPNIDSLARKVSNYLFRSGASFSSLQYHRVRAGLLQRGHERALYGLYLFNRKAKKISHSLIGG